MKDFRNFIQEEEKKHTGIKPDATDLIRISDANHYFNSYKTEQLNLSGVGSSGSEFEKDLFKLINNYCKNGLKKPELVKKMEWVLGSCKIS